MPAAKTVNKPKNRAAKASESSKTASDTPRVKKSRQNKAAGQGRGQGNTHIQTQSKPSVAPISQEAVDPLFLTVTALRKSSSDKINQRQQNLLLSRAITESDRLRRVCSYLARENHIEPDEARQRLLLAVSKLLQIPLSSPPDIKDERSFYSYLIRSAINDQVKELRKPDANFDSLDEHAEAGTLDSLVAHVVTADEDEPSPLESDQTQAMIRKYIKSQDNHGLMSQNLLSKKLKAGSKMVRSAATAKISTDPEAPKGIAFIPLSMRNVQIKPANIPENKTPVAPRSRPFIIEGKVTAQRRNIDSNTDHAELYELLKASKMKQADYANILGIEHGALKSYIYVRTLTVPAEVMRAARNYAKKTAGVVATLDKLYDMPMSKIVSRWVKEAKQNYRIKLTPILIAQILGVDDWTVQRWNHDLSKPRISTLGSHEKKIQAFCKSRASRKPHDQ